MKKRQTSKVRRRPSQKVLEVRVMSPRIAWFVFLKFLGGLGKFACVLAALALVGWGVWEGIQRAFYQNPDFRLRVIDLNENTAVDAAALVEITGIDIEASLFDIDVDAVAEILRSLPQVASASAERHLPDKLVVRVTARQPRARIACPESGYPSMPQGGTLLVDAEGYAYLSPNLQLDQAVQLPIIYLRHTKETPVHPGIRLRHHDLKHAFRLLDTACAVDPDAIRWIESIEKSREWSLLVRTRSGTMATFGTGDHARQVSNLRAALDHATRQGYQIDTINLIPKENVPITVYEPGLAPRALPVEEPLEDGFLQENFEQAPEPSPEEAPPEPPASRRSRDLENLLNRD